MFGNRGNDRNPSPYSGGGAALVPAQQPGQPAIVPVVEPFKYGNLINITKDLTADSILVLPAASNTRTLLIIQNIGTTPAYINFGTAAAVGSGIWLSPAAGTNAGGSLYMDAMVSQDQIFAATNAGSGLISITYSDRGA